MKILEFQLVSYFGRLDRNEKEKCAKYITKYLQYDVTMAVVNEKTFSNKFLEECLIYFKMCGDGKEYAYIVRCGVCNIYGNYM